jgi:uncharacterized protein YjiS (DUF1127 family)
MSDYELRDIGLTRAGIEAAIHGPTTRRQPCRVHQIKPGEE